MGRKYIGIEVGDHVITHCVERLRKVIAGETGGVSGEVGWHGGGSYRFLQIK
jgi:adenine-specific DNA-methyltransferase